MNVFDYLTTWHKSLLALIFFGIAIAYGISLADNVQSNQYEIQKINLWRQNQLIWQMQDAYKCYTEESCLAKMSGPDRTQYRELLEKRKEMQKGIKK